MSNEPTEMRASRVTRTKAAEELADRYVALWNEPDADRRRRTFIVAGHNTVDPAERESFLASEA